MGTENGVNDPKRTVSLKVEGSSGKDKHDKGAKVAKSAGSIPFYKLFVYADLTDIVLMIIGSLGAAANGSCMPLMALLFGNMINAFGKNQGNNSIAGLVSKVSLEYVYLAIGIAAASFLQVTCWMVTGERQAARIRNLYLKAILRQDIGFFDKGTNTGEVVGRMSGDAILIQDAMSEKVGKLIQLIATIIGGFIVAFVKGWLLTLVLLSCIPLIAASGAAFSFTISKMATRGQSSYAQAAVVVDQTIGAIRTVASFTGEKLAIAKYNKAVENAYRSSVFEGFAAGMGVGTLQFFSYGCYALAVWFGAKMILHKGYDGGTVINVIFAILTGAMSIGQATPCVSAIAAGQAAAYKIFEAINREPKIVDDPNGKILDDMRGDIELRDVCFSYPTRPDEQIFSRFSLSIPRGKTVALVGESGSGKSTVISLIERFYDPLAGQVLIDGIDLREFQLKWIRQKIGLVSQEPVLFATTIRENIAYGKDDATLEQIKAATELANAAKFIKKLPQGLDTLVGEHGTQLSGGQKQRIAIARAILKDPRILLLDEATSALDAESERIVQQALDRVMVNRTTVVVAHRLSTVRDADMIAVIYRGKVVEKGTHSELTENREGAYSQLIRLQEMTSESEQQSVDTDVAMRPSSQRTSSLWSPSRVSPRSRTDVGSFSPSVGKGGDYTNGGAVPGPGGTTVPPSERPTVSIWHLASFNKPEIPVLLLGSIFAIFNGLIMPVFAILLSSVIKIFYEPDKLTKASKFWAVMFAALGSVSLLAQPTQTYLFSVAGGRLIQRIRSMCFERVVRMEVGWFDEPDHSSGAIGARLSADAASVKALVGDALGLLVRNVASALAGLLIAFLACWELAFIVLALLPLVWLNTHVQMKFMKGFSADAKKKFEEASQVANDAVSSIRTVASFCAEDKVIHMYEEKCKGPINAGIKQGLISGAGFGVSSAMVYLAYAACFYAGAELVDHGKTTFARVFRVFLALTLTATTISHSSSLTPDLGKAKNAAASVFTIMDRKSKIDPSDESGKTLDNLKGAIELHHVSFRYPTRPEVKIFHDLSLVIHEGTTVALVGESGSGKSTVISLLQRFYDPDSGCITLDGIKIKQFQLKWLRQQMGLVSQEPVLFNDTIRANISYGKDGKAAEAEIVAAAELANAHKFISGLQQGYDTIVGERGIQLSGGQKQRVAIARAIVKSPKILLLDEATSALDAESEQVVQEALDRVMVNRTTVVVAHRLTTIKGADKIAVVKNGAIVEQGKHESLLRIRGGVYASLVALHTSASSS
ncbi:hypothetical protein Droror1_Dr00018704 [Drosera rotundifolia]